MKFTLSKEAKTGIMVFITLACSIWGFNYLKGINLFADHRYYYTVFPHADGLEVSAPILVNGFQVGTVADVEFMEGSGHILVQLRISENKLKITNGTTAILASPGLLSGKVVELRPGNGTGEIAENDTLPSFAEGDMLAELKDIIIPLKEKAERLIESIDSVVTPLRAGINHQSMSRLNESMDRLPRIMQNLETVTGNAGQFVAMLNKKQEDVDSMITNLRIFTDSLKTLELGHTLAEADKSLGTLNQILEKIHSGEGTLGAMLNDPKLYRSLDSAGTNLQLLLHDLRENPDRYLHFSLIRINRKSAD